jgi:hypothetical protein
LFERLFFPGLGGRFGLFVGTGFAVAALEEFTATCFCIAFTHDYSPYKFNQDFIRTFPVAVMSPVLIIRTFRTKAWHRSRQ